MERNFVAGRHRCVVRWRGSWRPACCSARLRAGLPPGPHTICGRWQRFWDSEQNSYTKETYHPQQVHAVLISSPGAGDPRQGSGQGRRLLATLGSQNGCTGGFKNLYARAWRLDAALAPTRVLEWTDYADDGYPAIQGRIRPDDLLVQYRARTACDKMLPIRRVGKEYRHHLGTAV